MNWRKDFLEIVDMEIARKRRLRYIELLAADIRVRMNIDEDGRNIARKLWGLGTYSNWRAVETWLDHRFPDNQYKRLPNISYCCSALAYDLSLARSSGKGGSYARK